MLHWWPWERWISTRFWERLEDDRFELRGFIEEDLRDDVAVGMKLGLEEQVTYVADRLVAADGRSESFGENRGEDLV